MMAAEELKSAASPETDENPASCVINPGPDGDSEPEEGEIVGELLAMIGEQFDHGDEICGVVVNVRARQEKVSLCTKNASNESAMVNILKQWKEFLDYSGTIGFIFHVDAMKDGKSAKNRYTV